MSEFRSLLPPNATKFEVGVEEAIRYDPDLSVLAGFKFNTEGSDLSLILTWEYVLSQIPIDDLPERIRQGMLFHMYCGTPYALRLAMSWYGFNDIIVEEEGLGAHFFEFQIGLDEIPNDLDAAKMVEVATMAAPLRSRLSRMYNDLYDIRRFVLDQSDWGDLLSDHSGYRFVDDGPKFSFGRINNFAADIPLPEYEAYLENVHYGYARSFDTYRLDWVILDESSPGTLNYDMSREVHRYMSNTDYIGDKMGDIFKTHTIARALIVLSEDAILDDDINSCFSCGTITYEEDPFELDYSFLSESVLVSTEVLIAYRDYRENFYEAENEFEVEAERGYRTREHGCFYEHTTTVEMVESKERFLEGEYKGNNTWHNLKHFDVAWEYQKHYLGKIVE